MSRVFAILASGLMLAACSSLPSMDFFKSSPPTEILRLESEPAGADARVQGQACRTPCELPVTLGSDMAVTFTLNGYQPQTVPVQTVPPGNPASGEPDARLAPNPVVVALDPAGPPRKPPPKRPAAPRKPSAPRAAKPAAAPASAFPAPPPAQSAFPAPPPSSAFPPPPAPSPR